MNDQLRARARWIESNVLPHEAAIRTWLWRHQSPAIEVDDIIQEMYAKIGTLPSVDHIQDPQRYALQIAHTILLAHIRRARIVSITAVEDIDAVHHLSGVASPEEIVSFRDELKQISDALDTLPKRSREVLLLRRVQGLSQRETAERLDLAEKTVEKYLTRAIHLLMDHFGRGGKTRPQASNTVDAVQAPDDECDDA